MRGLLAFFDPCFDFFQIPDDAAGREPEAPRELAALLHLVDRRLGQGDDLVQLVPANGATKEQGKPGRKLRQVVIAIRTRMRCALPRLSSLPF